MNTITITKVELVQNPEDQEVWGISVSYSDDPIDADILEMGSKSKMQDLFDRIKDKVVGLNYRAVCATIDEALNDIGENNECPHCRSTEIPGCWECSGIDLSDYK